MRCYFLQYTTLWYNASLFLITVNVQLSGWGQCHWTLMRHSATITFLYLVRYVPSTTPGLSGEGGNTDEFDCRLTHNWV
jgi:hypothetical protein